MNVKTIIAASALAVLGNAAFAFETPDLATPSTLSRAAVVAELVRAQKAGEIVTSSQTYFFVDSQLAAAQQSTVSRAQVKRELARSADVGTANEAFGSVEVRAETISVSPAAE